MTLKNLLLSLLSGILLWLAWPTYGFSGLLFIAFVPLLLAERNLRNSATSHPVKKVWLLSYLSFVIWNLSTTYWLYFSTPFGMFFAVLVNALLMSLVFLAYHIINKKATQGTALTFLASLWILFEYLHLHWDFSWPWLNLGNGFSETTSWIQWYEFTGTFGGSLWVWLVNIAVFLAIIKFPKEKFSVNSENSANAKILIQRSLIPITLIVLPIIVSYVIQPDDQNYDDKDAVQVVVVQPNFDPYQEKFTTSNKSIMDTVISIITPVVTQDTDFIITPETLLADDLQISQLEMDDAVLQLRRFLNDFPKTSYLGGVSLIDLFEEQEKTTSQSNYYPPGGFYYNVYNSAMYLSASQKSQLYHKSKLVVGVENFPYKSILEPILGDVMLDMGGTIATKTTQNKRSIFKNADSTGIAPIICYESVYGEYVTDYVKNGAEILAIITNDGWWGNTQGHQQHLSIARLRAIENRRWVARSANTGISAIINPEGEIISSLGYEKRGALKETIYKNSCITFYATHGDYIVRIAGLMAVFIVGFSYLKRGTMKRK
jgi:apolipoprotein N-acyltransferase